MHRVLVAVFMGMLMIPFLSAGDVESQEQPKLVLLGFDGLDYRMMKQYMEEGDLETFRQLGERGTFMPLQTSLPPQSPVAWSNIITGMNPGGHGIFDFIARDPQTYFPAFSTTSTQPGGSSITIGDWIFPLSGGEIELLRKGRSFWEILSEAGIRCTVMRMPANFPPVECEARSLSGMGTPDVLGSYGTFLTYTTDLVYDKGVGGGRIYEVDEINYVIEGKIPGPDNPFRKGSPPAEADFTLYIDPENPVAKIVLDDQEVILQEGEWSEWLKVTYKLAPWQSVHGICRMLLRSVRPEVELYVTPVNMDPAKPALPISVPDDFAAELAKAIGPYYTQGMAEDTQALRNERLTDAEFLHQTGFVMSERWDMFRYELDRYEDGMLFFYFSSTDLLQHVFWRSQDPLHPAYTEELGAKHGAVIRDIYREADQALAYALERLDDDVRVMVVSDHGFRPFRRAFNLNTWLHQEGYLRFLDETKDEHGEFLMGVDWGRTRAYALGFNGLYLNLRGREGRGIVNPGPEAKALIQEMVAKLEAIRDPENGEQVIAKAYVGSEWYSGSEMANAPDIVPGYAPGYRAADETVLGETPVELIRDNSDQWSGDHLIDPRFVPGILACSEPIAVAEAYLYDIAPTILAMYGLQPPPEMVGKPILKVDMAVGRE